MSRCLITGGRGFIGSHLADVLCSSDVALTWAAEQVGRYAWTLGAPRARSIGVNGAHSRPEIYHRYRMGEVELREYEGELTERRQKEGACASS